MYNIVMLGCENSHAASFLELMKKGEYPELCCTGVYSREPEAALKLHEKYGVRILNTPDEAVGEVDGVIITARHGADHYGFARPYMPAGIPMFIDKPITCSGTEAADFMRDARAHGIRLCGGSVCPSLPEAVSLKKTVREKELGAVTGGNICCPIKLDSVYGGFYFYSQHLAQTMMSVFGYDVREVFAAERGDNVTVIARYDSYDITGTYLGKGNNYEISVYGEKGIRTEKLTIGVQSFSSELDDMMSLLKGGEMEMSYEDFAKPVFVLDAIYASMRSGKWEKVGDCVL